MKLLGSVFIGPDDALEIHEGNMGPVIKIGDLNLHFRTKGKLLELLDHINAYIVPTKSICQRWGEDAQCGCPYLLDGKAECPMGPAVMDGDDCFYCRACPPCAAELKATQAVSVGNKL